MDEPENDRESVLTASRQAYAHRAHYGDLIAQHAPEDQATKAKELDFLEHAFKTHAARPVEQILDVACGGGRHIVGLAKRGYECTGRDFTPERLEVAKTHAAREGVTVRLRQGDATKLRYNGRFDAVIALDILFLLPSDEDAQTCIRRARQALRNGGVFVCNIDNPFSPENWHGFVLRDEPRVDESNLPGLRIRTTYRRGDWDPVRGVAWIEETMEVEGDEGRQVFQDRERVRLFTYWDVLAQLDAAGFRSIACYPDWRRTPEKRPVAAQLVFVSQR
ncbi:MAG: class I SAM-dependent methyltransferase [Thermoplasmata archaeon]